MYVKLKNVQKCLELACYCYGEENKELKIKMRYITELHIVFLCQNGHCP